MPGASWSKERLLEVDRAWNDPASATPSLSPNPILGSNIIYTSKGRQAIHSKLERIRIDSLSYPGLPLSEVVKNLSDEARRRDPDRRGINIIVSANADPPSAPPRAHRSRHGFTRCHRRCTGTDRPCDDHHPH